MRKKSIVGDMLLGGAVGAGIGAAKTPKGHRGEGAMRGALTGMYALPSTEIGAILGGLSPVVIAALLNKGEIPDSGVGGALTAGAAGAGALAGGYGGYRLGSSIGRNLGDNAFKGPPSWKKDPNQEMASEASLVGKAAARLYKKSMNMPGMQTGGQPMASAKPPAAPTPPAQKSPLPGAPGAPNPAPTGQPLPAAAQLPPQQAPQMQMQPAEPPSPNTLRASSLMNRVVGGVNQMQQQPKPQMPQAPQMQGMAQ